jgi:hypothetical protein
MKISIDYHDSITNITSKRFIANVDLVLKSTVCCVICVRLSIYDPSAFPGLHASSLVIVFITAVASAISWDKSSNVLGQFKWL